MVNCEILLQILPVLGNCACCLFSMRLNTYLLFATYLFVRAFVCMYLWSNLGSFYQCL
jgi:hypothetical protein